MIARKICVRQKTTGKCNKLRWIRVDKNVQGGYNPVFDSQIMQKTVKLLQLVDLAVFLIDTICSIFSSFLCFV